MKKNYFYSIFLMLIMTYGTSVFGQASGYSLTAFSGTFTPLVGGTVVASVQGDDATGNITLPFSFTFEGTAYTSVRASSNGFVSFNTSSGSNNSNNISNAPASMRPALCPLWDDLDLGNGTFSWQVTGAVGSRIMTIEFLNEEWDWLASGPVISFQVKLYETTNVIDFVYRQEPGTPTGPDASIGLVGVSTFLSLQNSGTSPFASSSIGQNSIATKPATGQVYRFTPPSCLAPSAPVQDSAALNAVKVSWTSGGASDWQVEYGPVGFIQGTGTLVAVSTTNPELVITGLTAATCYEFYVRDSCGPTSTSNWTGPTVVCTVWPTPYLEDFDSNIPLNLGTNGSVSVRNYANAWKGLNITGNYNWLTDNNSTSSSPGGPGQDHTTGIPNAGVYMYTEASGSSSGNQAELVSPFIDLSGVTNPTIRLWYHRQGTPLDQVSLDIDTGSGWITLDDTTLIGTTHIAGAATDPWDEMLVNISAYQGTTAQFRLLSTAGGCCADPAIDDFEIFDLLNDDAKILGLAAPLDGGCEGEYNVAIDVQNNGSDTITSIDAAYSINGGAAVSETFTITINPFTSQTLTFTATATFAAGITNISAWTALTGDGFLGNDTLIDSVDMAPIVDSVIYCEGFETGTGGWSSGGNTNSWAIGLPANAFIAGAATDSTAAVTNLIGTYNPNEDSWFQSPCFDFSTYENDPELEFSHIYQLESGFDRGWLEMSTNGGQSWSKVGSAGSGTNWYTNASGQYWEGNSAGGPGVWQKARITLAGAAGMGDVKIRFVVTADGSVQQEGMGVDDITIVVPPNDIFADTVSTCGDPNFTLDAGVVYDTNATYLWSTMDTTASISGLTTGSYSVTITDKKIGIKTTENIEVIATDPPSINFTNSVDTIDANALPVVINLDPKLSPNFDYSWTANGVGSSFPFFIADPAELNLGLNTIAVTVVDNYDCSSTGTHQIFVSNFVGINELGSSKVSYYPNPVGDRLTVELAGPKSLGQVILTIMDNQGRTVYQSNFNDNSGSAKETIDVSGFATGMYIIQLQTETQVVNDKLIIE